MTEPKEILDRLRAKRGGHRGVCTKLAKEADELLHLPDDVDIDRIEIIRSLLEAKLKIVSEIDEEILGLCDVKDIEQEIEESAEVVSRILNAKRKLERALKPGISKVINKNDGQLPSQPIQVDGDSNSTHNTIGDQSNGTSQNEVNTGMSQPIAMTTTSTKTVKPKLPKLSLPKFKGDVTMWNTFWDSITIQQYTRTMILRKSTSSITLILYSRELHCALFKDSLSPMQIMTTPWKSSKTVLEGLSKLSPHIWMKYLRSKLVPARDYLL